MGPSSRPARRDVAVSATLRIALMLALLASFVSARPAHAEPISWRGLLDLVGSEWNPDAENLNTLTRGDSPYDAYRLRFFADAQVSEHLQILSQFVFYDTDGSNVYVDGVYASYTPWADRDAHVLAGKLPWPVGTWAPRTYSNVNPLLTAPLLYQYHSTLVWYALPPTRDVLLATAGQGQIGVNYFGFAMGPGMPIVDDSYWDVGAVVNGSVRPLEYALGVTEGAPSWGSAARDDNAGKTVLGRLGLLPMPWLRLGVSGAYGPYLRSQLASSLPPGRAIDDYRQTLAMADAQLQTGHLEVNAEGAHNTWQTPTVGDLKVDAGYVELKYQLTPAVYAAGRWDTERFGKITDSSGLGRPWDANVTRIETGVGYRFSRATLGKLVYQHNRLDFGTPGVANPQRAILAAQLSIGF